MSRIGKLRILGAMYCKNQFAQNSGFLWFQGPFFMILGGLGTDFHVDLDIFGTQTCSLACLVASLWPPGGSWDDPGTLGSTRQDTWMSGLEFFLIFNGFRDPISKAFWVPWTKKGVFVHARLQVSFSVDFWL